MICGAVVIVILGVDLGVTAWSTVLPSIEGLLGCY